VKYKNREQEHLYKFYKCFFLYEISVEYVIKNFG